MDTDIYKCPVSGWFFDPLGVQRKLLVTSKGQFNSWLADQRGDDEVKAMEAEEKLIPSVRLAFGLKDVDPTSGSGVPTSTCLSILNAYLLWVSEKKAKGQDSPSSSPCADCPQV